MIKKIILSLLILLTPLCAISKKSQKTSAADIATSQWKYDIEPIVVANGKIGVVTDPNKKVVMIWSYTTKPEIAYEQAAKNAVHAIVFKGIPSVGRVAAVKPLISDLSVEKSNAAYFNSFFATGGAYMRFVSKSSPTTVGDRVMKLSKKEYKVGRQIEVNINELRRELERAGIIKSLGGQF